MTKRGATHFLSEWRLLVMCVPRVSLCERAEGVAEKRCESPVNTFLDRVENGTKYPTMLAYN